jgi:hypothetical protein
VPSRIANIRAAVWTSFAAHPLRRPYGPTRLRVPCEMRLLSFTVESS